MVLNRLPKPYQPAPDIAAFEERFFNTTTTLDSGCQIWTGKSPRRVPSIRITGGREITIYDFAYEAQIGEVWTTLIARPACPTDRCIGASHLTLRRRKNLGAISGAELDEIFRRTELRGPIAVHRELHSPQAIAQAYGVDPTVIRHGLFERRERLLATAR